MLLTKGNTLPNWQVYSKPVPYQDFLKQMHNHVELMIENKAKGKIFLLEHEEIYTTGTSDDRSFINSIPLIQTNRGGAMTYHGPGQRIIYPVIDLRVYKLDLHWYLNALEQWVISALKTFGIKAKQSPFQRGVWVQDGRKVASVGIRVRKWIVFHGCSVNIETDLNKFGPIMPCGLEPRFITSCKELGKNVQINLFDQVLQSSFHTYFCM
jgi:lipoyl(octanoyl) transferase